MQYRVAWNIAYLQTSRPLDTFSNEFDNQKKLNVDFPARMIASLGQEASRAGVARQSIIKLWLAERLQEIAASRHGCGQ